MSGQQVRTNSHDANGSLTGDGVNSYTYDARGRMLSATAGGLTTTYAVNGLGQRVSKAGSGVQPSGAMVYAYDEAGHLIGEYDGVTGAAEQETVWLGDLPVAILTGGQTGGTVYNVHPDHLNAPKVITDQIGNVVWNWDHDPFGNGQPTGTLTYNLRFPGQYYDMESGLNYNMNRDYDPVLGRYVQSDPIGLDGGINTYGYVGQNPLWASDPLGLYMSNEQVSNVIYNETRSLSGDGIEKARRNLAHVILNGDDKLGNKRPLTAPDAAKVPVQEQGIYDNCLDAVERAREEREHGTDPTNGALNFNLRNSDSRKPFYGLSISTQSGPFNNSYSSGGLNRSGVYVNTYGGR